MKSGWSLKTVIRYGLYQVPSLVMLAMILLVIRHYIDFSLWIVCGIVLLWMVKDAILFPFVWRAYDRSRWGISGLMMGKQGIAEQRLAPSGYVRIHGELWKAKVIEGSPPIEKGEDVWVEGIHGLVLQVRPEIAEHNKNYK